MTPQEEERIRRWNSELSVGIQIGLRVSEDRRSREFIALTEASPESSGGNDWYNSLFYILFFGFYEQYQSSDLSNLYRFSFLNWPSAFHHLGLPQRTPHLNIP